MATTKVVEVKCECGEVFEAELVTSIAAGEDIDVKERILTGGLNLVKCPNCGRVFYAETFILYHDNKNQLLAYVYPLECKDQKEEYEKQMRQEFNKAMADFGESINYQPIILFGIEALANLLLKEQDMEDEEMIARYFCKERHFYTIELPSAFARKYGIVRVLPTTKQGDPLGIAEAVKSLVEYNPQLVFYKTLYDRISQGDFNPSNLGPPNDD
ncbi:MAG: CpXC domain-containing protein [Elusimicrobiota bacterium]|jgi:uncharacterized C2H2 Zn-finger protein|nr:CpXC domain-containing protein [Elusimicrobiota bacterium]